MNIAEILRVNYPNTEWVLTGDKYEGFEWLDDSPKPSEAQLESQWEEVQEIIATQDQAKIDSRTSALAKLAALGLTEDEIASL